MVSVAPRRHNTQPHATTHTRALLKKNKWEIFKHPPYNPNLAPSDYHSFLHLTKFLVGKSLKSEQEIKDTAQDRRKGLAMTFSDKGIQNPVPLYDKCLNLQCDYIYQQVAKKIRL